MLVSYKWLNELVAIADVTPQELADRMSLTGIEIEGVASIGTPLKNIVVGKTIEVIKHPDSDHLHITQVEVGEQHAEGGVLQIVCGAPNVAANQKVIVALAGARIVNNIKIKKGKIRGQESHGMLCSLEELGFSANVIPKEVADGIFILPDDAPVGADIVSYLGLDDAVLELSLTANRADAMSMIGVAYEVGAIYGKVPTIDRVVPTSVADTLLAGVSVTVDAAQTPYYALSVIKNVTVKPSPLWLQMRLMHMGIRPINNIVDVTNYMLMLYGQPLHAFDYATLPSQHMAVRLAKDTETLVTLDGVERNLTANDLVVTANDVPVALAGVMGGLETEITEQTTTVALETAVFDARHIRATSKAHGLRSESSARYEKGINLEMVEQARQHALALMAELSGGQVVEGVVKEDYLNSKPVSVSLTLSDVNHVLGTTLSVSDVQQTIERLGFGFSVDEAGVMTVVVPPRRWDITRVCDVVEEVARIYGYDNLPSTLPTTPSISGGLSPLQQTLRQTRRLIQSLGYSQVISYALTTPEKSVLLAKRQTPGVVLAMPMSEERSVLRHSLVPSLLDVAQYNAARHNKDLALYETGRVFYHTADNQQPEEVEHVALILTGQAQEKTWTTAARAVDFYDIKGALDEYFAKMNVSALVTYQASQKENMHPGRTADIVLNGEVIGYVGQIHPQLAKQYDLADTYVAEFEVLPILTATRQALVQQMVPRYPGMTRDVALLVDDAITHAQIVAILTKYAGRYLTQVSLFDHYKGQGIEPGKKSLAYRLTFLNLEATLVEEEINQAMAQVTTALVEELSAVIR